MAGSEDEVTPVSTEKLQTIVGEIGLRPSDLVFNNNEIVFVEGKPDRIVLAAFADRLGIDLINELGPSTERDGRTLRWRIGSGSRRTSCRSTSYSPRHRSPSLAKG